jgi:uncharacterized protein (DUF697 family)/GTP-binding protein EngB required for normal cell division
MIPTVFVCGNSNAGKTSLIYSCLDNELDIPWQSSDGVKLYKTPVAVFAETQQAYFLDTPAEKDVQAVWYCIDGSLADFEIRQDDSDFIRSLGNRALIVVTKCELLNEKQAQSVNDLLLKHFLREQIVLVSAKEKSGIPILIEKTKDVIMETGRKIGHGFVSYKFETKWDDFFSNRLKRWNQKNDEEANSYITWAAGRAAAIAIIPLPMADVAPLVANEIYMIYRLAGVYGIANDQSLITMILGCTGGSLAGKMGASLVPFLKIPIAAAVTYGVGKATKAFFESGMELNGETLKEIFENAMDEASSIFW